MLIDFASHLKVLRGLLTSYVCGGSARKDTKQVLTGKTSVSIAGRRFFKVL